MTDFAATQDPAEIERDIRRTQEEMSRTVDRIGDQLTPRSLLNALLDQAESANIDARTLLDGARRNPLALAMIAGGAIWLASDSDAKLPSFGSEAGKASPPPAYDHGGDYVSHMQQVDLRDGEDHESYQRRRDIARANYFMIERRHEEDDKSFRDRLDEASEALRRRRHDMADQARSAAQSVAGSGQAAMGKAQDLYQGNPLVGGLISAAAGAFFASMLPTTRMEAQSLGDLGAKARDLATEQGDKLAKAARDQKDELVSAVEKKVAPSHDAESGGASPQADTITPV